MKKILLSSLMAAAAAVPAFAGVDNINYQAVIKNGNEVVANSQVDMKFELLDNETVVYSEQQSMTTNASGLVSCQLGGEELSTIEWGDLTLRVSINFGNGYEVISNETVSSVPTALYALRSADGDNLRAEIDDFANLVEFRFDKVEKGLGDTDNSIAQLTEMTDAFATMNEQRIDRLQSQVDRLDEALEVSGTTDYSALVKDLEELKTQTEEGLAKVDVFADAFDEIEAIVAANEETQATLRNMSADIAQVEGIAKEIEELNTNTESFAEMTEARFDKVEKELGDTQKEIAELNTNTESFATMVEERFDKVEKELSNTDQTIEEIGGLVKDVEEIQSNVKNLSADVAQIEGLATKVETLENSFNILTKGEDGEEGTLVQMGNAIGELGDKVEELNTGTESFATMVEERFDKVEKELGDTQGDIEGLNGRVDNVESTLKTILHGEEGEEGMFVQIGNALGEVSETVEGLVKENEDIKANLKDFGADVAQIEGLAQKVEKLEDSVKNIADSQDEDSVVSQLMKMGEAFAAAEEKIGTIQDTLDQLIQALKDLDVLPNTFKAGK